MPKFRRHLVVGVLVAGLLGLATPGAQAYAPGQFLQWVVESLVTLATRLVALESTVARPGLLVEPGLYEVHRRVVWDVGWLHDDDQLVGGYFEYNEHPRKLVYASSQDIFLRPLSGRSMPAPTPGAERLARLYVNYGHQWMCDGIPTIRIGNVDFELPMINGFYGAMSPQFSQLVAEIAYRHLVHTPIHVFLKDYSWAGPDCGAFPGADRVKGVVYRIEARFYDRY